MTRCEAYLDSKGILRCYKPAPANEHCRQQSTDPLASEGLLREPLSLSGKKIHIPPMAYGSAKAFAAAFRAVGLEAEPTPPSDHRTRELGAHYTSGDECYPAKVTVGDFMKVLEAAGDRPRPHGPLHADRARALPLRPIFALLRHVLDASGYRDTQVLAPSSNNGYGGLGDMARPFMRTGWRALLGRRYPAKAAAAVPAARARIRLAERGLRKPASTSLPHGGIHSGEAPGAACRRSRTRWCARATASAPFPDAATASTPLIGIVGEIFCRLNTFSNENLIRAPRGISRRSMALGHRRMGLVHQLRAFPEAQAERPPVDYGSAGSMDRHRVQKRDEHVLLEPFRQDFVGLRRAGYLRDPGVRAPLPAA